MKKALQFLFLLFLLVSLSANAQTPQRMSYQSVVRNASGQLATNANVGIKVSLLQGSVSGAAVFSETHQVMTNTNGLVSIEIGGGNAASGNFADINWASGPYFIKSEIDPQGGSNYSIVGVSQLLSVPYALYAENTKSQGKSTIFITGDITDQQAQEKLAKELGPFTEYITVTNTTALTTLNLNGIDNLFKLEISNNSALTSLQVNNLKNMYGNVLISNNGALGNIAIPTLVTVRGAFEISNNPVSNIALPSFQRGYAGISFWNNNALTNLSLPVLQNITNSSNFEGGECNLIIRGQGLTSISLPALQRLYTLSIMDVPNLATINLSSLTKAAPEISGTKLTTLSLPNFTTSNGHVYIRDNSLLTSISFPNYAATGNYVEQNFQNNNLPSAQVNYILGKLVATLPLNHKTISLRQLPPAPPTGQGITDKYTLISNGNSVNTD